MCLIEIESTLRSYGTLPPDQRDSKLALFKQDNRELIGVIMRIGAILSVGSKPREIVYE